MLTTLSPSTSAGSSGSGRTRATAAGSTVQVARSRCRRSRRTTTARSLPAASERTAPGRDDPHCERRTRSRAEGASVEVSPAIDRFLSSAALSDATRRAYRGDLDGFAAWLAQEGLALGD